MSDVSHGGCPCFFRFLQVSERATFSRERPHYPELYFYEQILTLFLNSHRSQKYLEKNRSTILGLNIATIFLDVIVNTVPVFSK